VRLSVAVMFLAFSPLAFALSTPTHQATVPASQETAFLSPNVLNRVLALIANNGPESELTGVMATALGLTEGNQPWPFRQIGARADEADTSAPLHVFAIHRGTDEDVLLFLWINGMDHFIRAHRNGQAVKAIAMDPATMKMAKIAITDAQKEANDEFYFWDRNVEKTARWGACESDVLGAHPVDPEKKIEACTWLIQSGKESQSSVALAYLNRGMAYKREDAQKRLEDFNHAVKEDPANADVWAQLCSAQNWISEDAKLAAESCTKAIGLNPHSSSAWTFRGDIYLRTKEYDLAIADYDHAIKLTPKWMWPLDNRGEAYLRKNQFDRAIQDFNEVIRVSPDYAMGYLDRGIAQMRKNDMNAALADFETGIKIDPTCGSCFFGQGLVKRAKGDRAGADADITKAKTLVPNPAEAFVEDGISVQ
jgi:tetratricopeptide (TPR) repeat protein